MVGLCVVSGQFFQLTHSLEVFKKKDVGGKYTCRERKGPFTSESPCKAQDSLSTCSAGHGGQVGACPKQGQDMAQ